MIININNIYIEFYILYGILNIILYLIYYLFELNKYIQIGGVFMIYNLTIGILSLIPRYINYRNYNKNNIHTQNKKIIFRVVTKGINIKSLLYAVKTNYNFIIKNKYINKYTKIIDIVTDVDISGLLLTLNNGLEKDSKTIIRQTLVDSNYSTTNHTQFKARALQYALDNSPDINLEDCLFHLDEESLIDPDTFKHLHYFINSDNYNNRIAQGLITYITDKNNITHYTVADTLRIYDSVTRMSLGHMLGYPHVGFCGSFIIIKNEIEKKVSFNLPLKSCITEDTSFIFSCYDKKYYPIWIPGRVIEKSPDTYKDYNTQRTRWKKGLIHSILDKNLPLLCRISLGTMLASYCGMFIYVLINILKILYSVFILQIIPIDVISFDFIVFILNTYFLYGYIQSDMYGNKTKISLFNIVIGYFKCFLLEIFTWFNAIININKINFKVINKKYKE